MTEPRDGGLRLARTRDEALLYLDLHPCERCGSVDVAWESALVDAGGELARSYSGYCASCGEEREYLFRLPEPGPVDTGGALVAFGGETPSELLDAGEWLWVADLTASAVPVDDPVEARRALDIAAGAVDEVLKFVPAGADRVPDEGFWSERGREVRAAEPGRFDRDRLVIVRDTYREERARLYPEEGAAMAPAAVEPEPAEPADLERARERLRAWLTAIALAIYPETTPLVEDDPGPREVEPGRWECPLAVTSGAASPPWYADRAVAQAGDELTADGWAVEGPRHDGDRYEVVGRRNGFTVVVSMLQKQGILRLSGRTPALRLTGIDDDTRSSWRPANPVEEALLIASRRGDQENLLGLLRAAPLFLPAPDDLEERSADGETIPFGTLDLDGVVHVAAYTSPETLVYALGDEAEGWVETTYRALAARWPDPAWRLAVDVGTPIETSLPVATGRG